MPKTEEQPVQTQSLPRNNFFSKIKKSHSPKLSTNKKLEQCYSPKAHRTIFNYEKNFSASLSLPVEQEMLNDNLHNMANLLKISKSNILEHAARRVDLFFYTLVAYYKTNIVPEMGWTKLQHGKGRHGPDKSVVTQACHSSFIPSLIDETLNHKIPVKSEFDHLSFKTSLVCSTHFMDSLASTLELPFFVNEFDEELEEKFGCRKRALSIISEVAKGNINPAQGLQNFLLMMQNVFAKMLESKHFFKSLSSTESIPFKMDLLALIKEGTLKNKYDEKTQSLNENYIWMLLRLKPEEIKSCYSVSRVKDKIIQQKYLEIQNEIQSTPSEHVRVLKR